MLSNPNNKIILSIIFLTMIFYLGIVTTFEDFKNSKIRNKWILTGLIYSFFIYLIFWILYRLAIKEIVDPIIGSVASYLIWNFDKWCINLAISTIVAYLLWYFKMWAAGDAKLFITYAALIPMGQYSKVYFNYYFASFLLLVTIFIPATIFLFLKASFYFFKQINFRNINEEVPKLIKDRIAKIKPVEALKILFGFFCFFLFFRLLRLEFRSLLGKFLPNQNILTLISLLAFRPLSKIFKKKGKFLVLFFAILVIYFVVKIKISEENFLLIIANTLNRSILIMLLFSLAIGIIHMYEKNATQKTMPFAFWMFLGALITWFI